MRYRTALLTAALAAALLLAGCGQDKAPAASSEPPAPAASASAPASSTPAVPDTSAPAPDASTPATLVPDGSGSGSSEPILVPGGIDGLPTDPETLKAACANADWSWFDDAVFIGDSVSLKLSYYVTAQRKNDPSFFGKAQFLTSGSLGSGNALWEVSDESVHPTYQGEKMLLEESIPLTGAKKIYMMLGMNDIALYGLEGSLENYGALIGRIQQAVPDAQFYIQSATPICQGAEKGALNNENMEEYDQALREFCDTWQFHFVDVASVMRDADGYLPREYCSDPDGMGIHMTDLACQLWLGYLALDAQAIQNQ